MREEKNRESEERAKEHPQNDTSWHLSSICVLGIVPRASQGCHLILQHPVAVTGTHVTEKETKAQRPNIICLQLGPGRFTHRWVLLLTLRSERGAGVAWSHVNVHQFNEHFLSAGARLRQK